VKKRKKKKKNPPAGSLVFLFLSVEDLSIC